MSADRELLLEKALKEALEMIDPMLPTYIMESDLFSEKETWAQLTRVNRFIEETKKLLGQ